MLASILIPTFNERENIQFLIPKILEKFVSLELDVEIIVIDDSSPDGTGEVVDELAKRYPGKVRLIRRDMKLGIGSAYKSGFKAAKGDVIFEMDADLSHDPIYLPDFVSKIRESDIVVGSRYVPGGGTVGWAASRRVISAGANLLVRFLLGIGISDATSGYRAYRSDVVEYINYENVESEGYAFQVETLTKAIRKGFKVEETPIIFKERLKGRSKLSKLDIVTFVGTLIRLLIKRR